MSISSPPRTFSPTHPSLITTTSAASNSSSSPEFEFSLLRNPSLHLLSADQLFSGGFLLPLHLLDINYNHNDHKNDNNPVAEEPVPQKDDDAEQPPRHPVTDKVPLDDDGGDKSEVTENKTADAAATESVGTDTDVLVVPTVAVAASKRWKDIIFKKKVTDAAAAGGDVEKGSSDQNQKKNQKIKKERVLSKRKETTRTNNSGSSNGGNSGELININLWPFSRSSSAGNNAAGRNTTTKAVMNRKVSSAPCSRSNSAGESNSSSKRWHRTAAAGFHIGKNPVWHVRKVGSSGRNHEASQPPPTTTNVINSSTNSTTSDNNNVVEKVIEKDLEKLVDMKKDSGEESRRFGKAKSESNGGVGGGGGILGGGVLGGGGMKGLVMNLSVPMCMGYRSHSTHCRDEDLSPVVAGNGGDEAEESGGAVAAAGGNMLNLRSLFTKRVH
ncbi:hypothetical protein Droror1_Dr00005467 [Drosera rotundifolia]